MSDEEALFWTILLFLLMVFIQSDKFPKLAEKAMELVKGLVG